MNRSYIFRKFCDEKEERLTIFSFVERIILEKINKKFNKVYYRKKILVFCANLRGANLKDRLHSNDIIYTNRKGSYRSSVQIQYTIKCTGGIDSKHTIPNNTISTQIPKSHQPFKPSDTNPTTTPTPKISIKPHPNTFEPNPPAYL